MNHRFIFVSRGAPLGDGRATLLLAFLLAMGAQAAVDSNSPALPAPAGARQAVSADDGDMAPPPPLPAKSPVDVFRNLLAMSPVERRQFLTNRPPESQKRLLAKIREYELLNPDDRELRLRVTELRWYLLPLMSTAPANRKARLEAIPPEIRPLVEQRLFEWDMLPPPLQKELLQNQAAIQFFTEVETAGAAQKTNLLSNLSPAQREMLEGGFSEWQEMAAGQRQRILRQFDHFFGLSPEEKKRTLNSLSAAERQQIDKTLKSFAALAPAQRSQAIRSFGKFASLSPEDRQQFLRNAQRWEQMTPAERQSWRNLVNTLTMLPVPPSRLAPSPPALPPRVPPVPPGLATN